MDPHNVDLKQTINLPKTAFPMKANLPQTEPKLVARWENENLYAAIRASRAGRPTYILHDGPPYANGRIHLGTAFNKILKDFMVKSKTMAGFDSPYVPGWDCHGLPIEIKVDSELGAKKAHMPAVEIRRACRKYAEKYIGLQRTDFKRLGVLGQWDDPYLTMSAEYQATIAGAFVEFLDRGYVYKGLKPVHWCIKDRTALAEAEVEYQDHESPSIWVRFRLTSDPASIDPALAGREVYSVIWTTTPWTIPANMAIAFHPKYEYVAAEVDGTVYIVAAELLEATRRRNADGASRASSRASPAPGSSAPSSAIPSWSAIRSESWPITSPSSKAPAPCTRLPAMARKTTWLGGNTVSRCIARWMRPGACFKLLAPPAHCPRSCSAKPCGRPTRSSSSFCKPTARCCGAEKVAHSYPHCWRCHQPVIFRATEQWFIGMDRNGFRDAALEAIGGVEWMPEWGRERISNMVASRPDWCISRQRVWGVPIIVFYCEGCREPVTDRKILDGIVALFREHSADVWYERTAAELLPPGFQCAKCGGGEFSKESDILDVWFDSGSSHLAVLNSRFGLTWPADMYIEGGDQYRGWFQSSLLVGVGIKGGSPYRASALSGWLLDGEGKAMHKSLGNAIEPDEIIREHGAEIIRLWASSVEFHEDVRASKTILTRLTEAYRKLRNTFRYLLGNLNDFDSSKDALAGQELQEIDQWILLRAEDLVARCLAWYGGFEFHKVYHSVYAFATVDLSAIYFDVLKDRLYTSAAKSKARRSAQTALYRLLDALVRLVAPLMSFTAEEVWTHMGRPGSVHTALFPAPAELCAGMSGAARERAANWDRLIGVRDEVLKSLETARQDKLIGAPLEARVRLSANGDLLPLLGAIRARVAGLVHRFPGEPGACAPATRWP